jgi:hypothetical protein
MSNIVTQPEDRDPNALAQERSTPSLNTPEPQSLPSPPSLPAPPAQPANPSTPPDHILPALPSPLEDQNVPSLFEQFQPMSYEAPDPVPLLADDAERLAEVQAQALQEEAYDDVIFSNNLRQRVQEAHNVSSRTRYAPPIPASQRPLPGWLNRAEDLIQQRQEAVLAAAQPPALNPARGVLGVGRNVLAGRPFSNATVEIVNDQFQRLAEVEGEEFQGLSRRVFNLLPRQLRDAVPGLRFIVGALEDGEQNIQIIRDLIREDRRLGREDPSYRSLGSRALEELQRTFIPTPQQQRDRIRNLSPQPPVYGPDPLGSNALLLGALANNSAAFRSLLDDLAPTLDEAGNSRFNLFRGEFGDFGSAGAFSAGMYLMNMAEGVVTGTLYDIADDVRREAARINPEWAPPQRNLQRVDALSAFYGRDTGFTNEYSEDKYLAAAGNPALSWMPRRLQWATGFVGDLVIGGFADGIVEGILTTSQRAARQTARQTLRAQAESVLGTLDDAATSVATDATVPLVNTLDNTPVTRARLSTTPNNQLVTVEDVVDRVEGIVNRLDDGGQRTLRVADATDGDTARRMVEESTRNYELSLQNSVREAESLVRTMTREDFQGFVSSTLNRLSRRGVNVSADGVISRTFSDADALLDNLVAPVRAELATPLYREYTELLDMYREAPLALPPEAFDLVKRTDQQLADLAKTWEVLPNDATASAFRTIELQSVAPEFGNVWGTRIDDNIGQPVRRMITEPENGLMLQPEQSQMIGSLPPVTVDVPATAVTPPDDVVKRMNSIQAKYAEAAEVAVNGTGSAQRKAIGRMETLRQEGARLIADYPDVALNTIAEQQPLPRRYRTPSDRTVAQLDTTVKHQAATHRELQRQLGVVTTRRQEQQQLLQRLPPLERRFPNSDINTELLQGSEPGIRAVNTPTSISPETVYPAARIEVWDFLSNGFASTKNTKTATASTAEGVNVRQPMPEQRARMLELFSDELGERAAEATVPKEFHPATVFYDEANAAQRKYMERTGQWYLEPLFVDPEEVRQFADPQAALQQARQAGVAGATDEEILRRYIAVAGKTNDVEFINLLPLARETPSAASSATAVLNLRSASVEDLVRNGELATLPEDEALAVINNMRDNKSIIPVVDNARPLQLTDEVALNLGVEGDRLTVEALKGKRYENMRVSSVDFLDDETVVVKLTTPEDVAEGNYDNEIEVPISLQQRLEIIEAHTMRRQVSVTPDGVSIDYTRKRLGNPSAHGEAYLNADGTVTKIGRIADSEVEMQRAAALQGFAPEALTDILGDDPNYRQFTMQHLEGYSPLEDLGDLPLDELSEVQVKLMRIIDNLHENGIRHGDLHEGNVMYNPATGDVKLIDFGLAEPIQVEKAHTPRVIDLDGVDKGFEHGDFLDEVVPIGDRVELLLSGGQRLSDDLADELGFDLDLIKELFSEYTHYVDIDFMVDGTYTAARAGRPTRDLLELRRVIQDYVISNPKVLFSGSPVDPDDVAQYAKYKLYRNSGFDFVDEQTGTFVNRLLSPDEFKEYEYMPMFFTRQPQQGLTTRPRDLKFPRATGETFAADYEMVNAFLDGEFGVPGVTYYHGTKHTVMTPGIDSWSLSNEFGPGMYLTEDINVAERYAKALPAQDVVTNSTSRIPRTDQVGNVRAVVVDVNYDDVLPVNAYADQIAESFDEALRAAGEDTLARNFKQWRKRPDDSGPLRWWWYLRERYLRDGRTSDLARLQLDIRDRIVGKGVGVFSNPLTLDVVVLDPSLIKHNSIPHAVESTGTIAEGLIYRHAVDDEMNRVIGGKTTQAIVEHDRLNIDAYVEEQLKLAASQQERETINAVRELAQAREEQQAQWLQQRASTKAQRLQQLEREASREINRLIKSPEEFCL